ncbi:thioredoxin family protein [Flavobacteriaceae bacterium F08102]|nr:thioredoxin family protein [Flavobacteriaceae bacterium F08102]
MKTWSLILCLVVSSTGMFAQQATKAEEKKLYDPSADAKVQIAEAVQQAKKEGKHVLLQMGGNWCGWCILFDKKVNAEPALKKILDANYVSVHINYSPENKNEEVFESLGYPQRFGFPVFVVLDGDGNRLHTQDSALLEEGKGHDTKKVMSFFRNWTPKALEKPSY